MKNTNTQPKKIDLITFIYWLPTIIGVLLGIFIYFGNLNKDIPDNIPDKFMNFITICVALACVIFGLMITFFAFWWKRIFTRQIELINEVKNDKNHKIEKKDIIISVLILIGVIISFLYYLFS